MASSSTPWLVYSSNDVELYSLFQGIPHATSSDDVYENFLIPKGTPSIYHLSFHRTHAIN